jgi:hypothetical protein
VRVEEVFGVRSSANEVPFECDDFGGQTVHAFREGIILLRRRFGLVVGLVVSRPRPGPAGDFDHLGKVVGVVPLFRSRFEASVLCHRGEDTGDDGLVEI